MVNVFILNLSLHADNKFISDNLHNNKSIYSTISDKFQNEKLKASIRLYNIYQLFVV